MMPSINIKRFLNNFESESSLAWSKSFHLLHCECNTDVVPQPIGWHLSIQRSQINESDLFISHRSFTSAPFSAVILLRLRLGWSPAQHFAEELLSGG